MSAGALVAAVAVPACGNTSDSGPSASGGSAGKAGQGGTSGAASARGGAAGESSAQPVACGTSTCKEDTLQIPGSGPYTIAACCADADTNTCGLDSSFLSMVGPTFDVACQPLAQPGALDKSCPNSPKVPNMPGLTITFPGCCRASGTCGYMLDTIGGLPSLRLGLGCVDSTPFLEGGAPQSCGDTGVPGAGGQGSGGASSAGGEPAAAGTTGG